MCKANCNLPVVLQYGRKSHKTWIYINFLKRVFKYEIPIELYVTCIFINISNKSVMVLFQASKLYYIAIRTSRKL